MIVRHCAGGVVFYANKVLILKNDRGEWTLPKGRIDEGELAYDSAIQRVKAETGVDCRIMDVAGNTMYEFFSRSRQQQVCNAIAWYIMETDSTDYILREDFSEGGFFKVKQAIEMLTHSKEKSLVDISYKKYKELKKAVPERTPAVEG
ncbi:NUDIX domain-containing protein [Asaccharospora irregularis]|uniref:NUDIX domain-containing protein n=1 Tax=Asaccharospora irregularis DSM 2635 TaxID=1121321 RepID=A0A1M5J9J1_9FIRM|nr:NUDIX hydrolase [Asaccharospora irregularis]SHG37244.1 NUDIX domain-containing protein [Asaccharospora irregularis DSM 2635]